jgi:integrase
LSAFIRRVELKSGEVRYYPVLNGRHVGGGYKLKKHADARLTRAIAEEAAGYSFENPFFREWAEDKWLPQVKSTVRKSTWESYESAMRIHLVPAFGQIHLKDLSVADVENWRMEKDEDGVHPRTFNKTLTVLGTCLNDAVRQKKIAENVAKEVKRMKEDHQEMKFLDPEQVRAILKRDCEIKPLLATAVGTGARQGELLGLHWGDVDLDNNTIRISRSYRKGEYTEPKSDYARRTILVPAEVCDLLRPLQGDKDEPCFPRNGKLWSPSTLLRGHFYPLLDELGIPRVRWHDLRHTYAALMIRLKCSLKWLQVQMGHSSIMVTFDCYGHLLPEVGMESVQELSNLLFS